MVMISTVREPCRSAQTPPFLLASSPRVGTVGGMLILLPPSEGKATGGSGLWSPDAGEWGTELAPARIRILGALAETDPSRVISLSGSRYDQAVESNLAVIAGTAPAMAAWARYQGVVWEALSPRTLSPALRQQARERIVVASGLGGLFRWDDPVPDYRLKMGASLTALGRVDRLWSTMLGALAAASAQGPVVDLLPREHAGAVPPQSLPAGGRWLRVGLVDGRGAAAGHNGKAAKGLLARALLGVPDDGVEAFLALYKDPSGYRLAVEPV